MQEVEVIKARNVLSKQARGKAIERLRVAAYCRVSTDSEDQLNSYKSQVQYYTDMIKKNKEWVLADIYADEAITGTQVTKREDFQRMINDCMNGDIDMVITKSISRFARNTLDTLKYVRMLKERNIAVYFEDEKINTLTMDGELLLVVLSSVAQQEVENISANVKKGLKMKMKRGELVGFQGCLGYDYDVATKSISINEEGAEVVRYIFDRYVAGAGSSMIARELNEQGITTIRGNSWTSSSVMGIINNEKYKGDILLGKTFTVDPISKRRLENLGEEDRFYIKDHHEPIISAETFARAQEIRERRNGGRKSVTPGKREKYSRQYAFSCLLECGFCGANLSRRRWHSSSKYKKTIWQCVKSTKDGKRFCPDSKGIPEQVIEEAFIESYKMLCADNKDVLEEFISRVEKTLSEDSIRDKLIKLQKSADNLQAKRKRLLENYLEGIVAQDIYEETDVGYERKLSDIKANLKILEQQMDDEFSLKQRVADFKKALSKNGVLEEFDRGIFESIIEKVIVGGYDEDGNKDPYKITFIYKTGFKNEIGKAKERFDKSKSVSDKAKELCSHIVDEVKGVCSYVSDNTRRDHSIDVKERYIKV